MLQCKYIEGKTEGLPIMNRLRSTLLLLLAAAMTVSTFISIPTSAQGSAALSIVPKKTYTIEAGKTAEDTLTIRNQDKEQPLNLSLRVIDFSYTDDSGAPKLMTDEDAPQTTWSLKPFLKVPETVTVAPNSSETVNMSLAIPEGHGAGDYYSAIVYSSGGSDGGNVGLSASGVTLVFAKIPGKVTENLTLEKLGAFRAANNNAGGEFAYFLNEKPQRIAYRLKNDGNVTESPVGTITLKPLVGKEITIQNINPAGSLALIGQSRTFSACIKQKNQETDFDGTRAEAASCVEPDLWPGYYRVKIAAYYGQNGNNTRDIAGTAGFWYLPWWFILTVTIILLYVGYHIWKFVRFIRSKNGKTKLKKHSLKK